MMNNASEPKTLHAKPAKGLPLRLLTFFAMSTGLGLAWFGFHELAMVWLLVCAIALLSIAEHEGPSAKLTLTTLFGIESFFIFLVKYGIEPSAHEGNIQEALYQLAHSIHFDIFVFLGGLYLLVNVFVYSGIIGDTAWRIVKGTKGSLAKTLVAILILTAILSGIYDGATIASIMGVVTLTILLSSGLPVKKIVQILLLVVVATNIGGVWFVLGEPTNILAAKKLSLSPMFFLQYAAPFAVPAIILCCIVAYRIVAGAKNISSDRPELEVLLEGISLRRTHSGKGTLEQTLVSIGEVELRHLQTMNQLVDEGIPDFEAALRAGIPEQKVYKALSINLNSEDLAQGLIEYYKLREQNDPFAHILIGDLLLHVKEEYKSRTRSRWLVIASGILLVVLLMIHAVYPALPTWLSTVVAGLLAMAGIQSKARKKVLQQTWSNVSEAFFLIAIFACISQLKAAGVFESAATALMTIQQPELTGLSILAGSAVLSGFADNIAIMDILTNILHSHPDWGFLAVASVVGTALGGFLSPIASVQAIIIATIIQRVKNLKFGAWVAHCLLWFVILLLVSSLMLLLLWYLGWAPVNPSM